jgi:protein-ribulosamine 3-kinase
VFLKINRADKLDMFDAEVDGLEALRAARSVTVPGVLAWGVADGAAYLVLEWLDMAASSAASERALGAALARQHRVTSQHFGWRRDNYIGSTPQTNRESSDWVTFFCDVRLGFQLKLAIANGLPSAVQSSMDDLMSGVETFFGAEPIVPSLLHGDLWSGNRSATVDGGACIFDPAVYFGDREADLAMTRLFGGFGPDFYLAYEAEWPLAAGWQKRVGLYNLYHLLNHFNIFGGGYLGQIEATVDRLIS